MKDPTIRRVLFFFLLISAVLVFVAVKAVLNINRSTATADWVNHAHATILETAAVRGSLDVADGALHTYVLTGDARDHAACSEAVADASDHLEMIKALTRQEPAQAEEVAALETLVAQRIAFIREVLAARKSGDTAAVQQRLAADAGGGALREVHRKDDRVKDDEMALLADRDTASYLQAQTTRWTVWTGVLLDVLLLAGVAWVVRDDIAARRRAVQVLEEANALLESRVEARTAELTAANRKLSAENLQNRWSNQALEHQLRYNLLIINSITDLVFVITKPLNISRINPAVVYLTGFEAAELVDKPLHQVVRLTAEGGKPLLFDPVARALQDGRDLRNQPAVALGKNGQTTPVRFNLFPLRDRDKVVGGVVILQSSLPPTGTG